MHPPPLWNEEERNTIIRLLHQAYQGDGVNAEAFAKKIVGDACKSFVRLYCEENNGICLHIPC